MDSRLVPLLTQASEIRLQRWTRSMLCWTDLTLNARTLQAL